MKLSWGLLALCALLAVDSVLFNLSVPPTTYPLDWTLVFFVYPAIGVPLMLGTLLSHESAHAWVARRLGVEVDSVTLGFLGGRTRAEGLEETGDFGRALIYLAGLGSDVLAILASALAFLALRGRGVAGGASLYTFSLLVRLLLLNGAPIAITDGGGALESLLRGVGSSKLAARVAILTLGVLFALPLALGLPVFPQPVAPPALSALLLPLAPDRLDALGWMVLLTAAFWGSLGALAAWGDD